MMRRPADGSGRRGARRGGQQGGEQSWDWGGATRGSRSSRRWSGDGGRAAARGEALHRRQEAEQSSTCPRKKKRGEGSGGPIWKS
jgi:hypothetical protein